MPPQGYFVISAVFHYLGPSFAVLLFVRVDVLGVAWLRIASAALVFALWRRPWHLLRNPTVLAWGVVLALMNACFYASIDRLPLGTVAAIEFVPVVALAALGARSARAAVAVVLAVGGVALLADPTSLRSEGLFGEPLGWAFATANALLFALYIVLADRVSGAGGLDALAAAMIVAAVVITPTVPLDAFGDPTALLAGVGVGLTSSVIPYVTDQLALRKLDRATYALLVALLPATAAVIGVIVLGQVPAAKEVAGVLLVVLGVAIRGASRPDPRPVGPTARSPG